MEIQVTTPKPAVIPQPPPPVEIPEKPMSPAVVVPPPPTVVDESTEPAASHLAVTDEQVEMIIVTYEDKIAKMQEAYQ